MEIHAIDAVRERIVHYRPRFCPLYGLRHEVAHRFDEHGVMREHHVRTKVSSFFECCDGGIERDHHAGHFNTRVAHGKPRAIPSARILSRKDREQTLLERANRNARLHGRERPRGDLEQCIDI